MSHRSFCIIPVRGGSKGVPRKNMADFGGLSLLAHTLKQAQQCFPAEAIFVSTEDAEMTQEAQRYGAQLIKRPAELAQDTSTTNSVVEHLLAEVDPQGKVYHHFTLLQVTSPLRLPEDIRRAEAMMQRENYDSVLSVCEHTDSFPGKMYRLAGDYAEPVAPELEYGRRQDFPKIYRRNGAIFSCSRAFFDRTGRLWGGRRGLVEMPVARSLDIDTPEDLQRAREYIACP